MKEKSIKKNAILNVIRKISSIIFPLITFPYISRVLMADNYGKISFCQSIISYFSLLAALGISSYAVREGSGLRNDRKKLTQFANEVFTINIITTIISYILLVVLIAFWSKLQSYKLLLFVLSLSIFFTTIGVDWIYTIYEDFGYITVRSIIIQLISLILMFLLVKKKDDFLTYACITVVSQCGANLFNFFHSKKYVNLRICFRFNGLEHLKPMLILFFNTLMITIYLNSDITILGLMKSESVVGVYTTSGKIYTMVKELINAVIIVVLPRMSFFIKNNLKKEFNKTGNLILKSLLVLLLPSIAGLFMLSRNVILVISGKEYLSGNISLQILCPALGFAVLACFYINAILLPNKQDKKMLISTLISSVANLGLNFILIPYLSLNGAAITTLIAEAIVAIMAFNYSKRYFHHEKGYFKLLFSILLGCTGIIATCIVISKFHLNLIVDTILKVVICIFVYIIILLLSKNEVALLQVNRIMKRKKN